MKYLGVLLVFVVSSFSHAESILQESHNYEPGEDRKYSLDWASALQLCVKIPKADHKQLKTQCSKRGGCLRISDKTNGRSYGYNRHIVTVNYDEVQGGTLDFVVSNEFDTPQNIEVTAFNPNYRIDEVFDMLPGARKEFVASSNEALAVFARIQVDNVKALVAACRSNRACLKVEYYDDSRKSWSKSWSWVASNSGVGKTLSPDEKSQVRFRVVNDYPMGISVRATASDIKPKTCEW
jgi:hypothetical protein